MSKWNGKRFSIYTSDEETVLGVINELAEENNQVYKELDIINKVLEEKTDLYGDHKGTWQGLSKPTLSDEGMKATVEDIVDNKIPSIELSLDTKANKDDVNRISSGTPLFASSINEMTDITKNYVNTTDGYLYIYSEGKWNKTGVLYQSTGLDNGQVKIQNLNDEVLSLIYCNEVLPNSNIKNSGHSNLSTNTYIIDRPIYKNTLKKITKIKLFCNKNNVVDYAFVNLGYFLNGQFVIYSSNQLSCVYGINEFDVDIVVDTNVTTYIAISGAIAFTTETTDNYFEIKGQLNGVGSYSYTSASGKLTFEISVSGIDEKTEKIIELNNKIEDIKNSVNVSEVDNNYTPLIIENFNTPNTNFTYTNCTANNGLSLGVNSSVNYKKSLAIDGFVFNGMFKITDLTSRFGLITLGSWSSKYLIDLSTKTLNIYTNYTDTTPVKTVDISAITFNLNENYVIKLIRDGWDYTLSVIKVGTNDIITTSFSNYDNTTTRLYTRANGYFGVGCEVGGVTCNEMVLTINHKESDCLIMGDSLTEGDQVVNLSRWARRLKREYFKGKALISGFGGDGTLATYTKLQNYIDLGIKFKYAIILIGMNNRSDSGYTEFTTNIDNIYNLLVSNGVIPIIAINPIPSSGSSYILKQRDYILSKGWKTIRLDKATTLNNDGTTYNTNLFNSDGVHLNAVGNNIMFNEVLKVVKGYII